jgi:hypothetical protein
VRQDYDKYYKTVITTPDQVEGDVKDKVYQIAGISLTKKAILSTNRFVIFSSFILKPSVIPVEEPESP